MSTDNASTAVTEPIAIFKVAHRYLLYDIEVVTYLRREHNIIGVLIGSLPQASQQNVFLGLPLELMPEEARLLVDKKVAFIVDDVAEHRRTFMGDGLSDEERKAYQAALRKQGLGAAREASKKSDERKQAALKKIAGTDNWNDIPDDMLQPSRTRTKKKAPRSRDPSTAPSSSADEETSLFAAGPPLTSAPPKANRSSSHASPAVSLEPYGITPTISYPPLNDEHAKSGEVPEVPASYPLYRHLHDQGYFMAPGLRFGCKYMAYPGDPLRFHSHFLCNGMDWDQEFDLLDLVGGGRLGTGVKKGFLVGGEEKKGGGGSEAVRAFSIEWGGM